MHFIAESKQMKKKEDNNSQDIIGNGALLVISALLVAVGISAFTDGNMSALIVDKYEEDKKTIVLPDPFEGIDLIAKAVYVWDINKKEVLYAKNIEAQLPLASVTKLMTALVANEILPQTTVVNINSEALSSEGDTGLFAEEKWTLGDLLDFTLLVSSNDGASAIAALAGLYATDTPVAPSESKKVFVNRMNKRAGEIGLTQTYFVNETGLDLESGTSGAYGSARDMAVLLKYIIENAPGIVDTTRFASFTFFSLDNILHSATNTNNSISNIPGLIASKTGFTELAGGNIVFAFDTGINHPIIISILGSSLEGRFTDAEKLVAASLISVTR